MIANQSLLLMTLALLLRKIQELVSQHKYAQLISLLLYITTRSKPDIAFVVNMLSKYTSNPSKQHWSALERIIKYLKDTLDHCLLYIGYPDVIESYSDANQVTDFHDIKSTSDFVFLFGGAAICGAQTKNLQQLEIPCSLN